MLARVQIGTKDIQEYRDFMTGALFGEIEDLGRRLAGRRVLQINATQTGGGVAEILHSTVPLLRGLGVDCAWQVLVPERGFFSVTKSIHNGLQGEEGALTLTQWDLYQSYNKQLAEAIKVDDWDIIVIHDPQPAAVLTYVRDRGRTKWLWRCHLDSRHASSNFRQHFERYLAPYDGLVFTMEKFIFAGLRPKRLAVIPMAIDPLTEKCRPMPIDEARTIVARYGFDTGRPLAVQVSRFDPWKDPLGVIAAWKLARRQVPGLQLALVGDTASDDPQGGEILKQVKAAASGETDLTVVADEADDRTVKAFQTAATVVLQKSLREGFGLTVSEALWSGTPVIGGNVGGIALQIQDGKNGFLVDSVEQTGSRLAELSADPKRAKQMGEVGREHVRRNFLMPRLLRDDMAFWAEVLGV